MPIDQLSNDSNDLSGLNRAPLSYGPGSGERPENFALTLFGAYQGWRRFVFSKTVNGKTVKIFLPLKR